MIVDYQGDFHEEFFNYFTFEHGLCWPLDVDLQNHHAQKSIRYKQDLIPGEVVIREIMRRFVDSGTPAFFLLFDSLKKTQEIIDAGFAAFDGDLFNRYLRIYNDNYQDIDDVIYNYDFLINVDGNNPFIFAVAAVDAIPEYFTKYDKAEMVVAKNAQQQAFPNADFPVYRRITPAPDPNTLKVVEVLILKALSAPLGLMQDYIFVFGRRTNLSDRFVVTKRMKSEAEVVDKISSLFFNVEAYQVVDFYYFMIGLRFDVELYGHECNNLTLSNFMRRYFVCLVKDLNLHEFYPLSVENQLWKYFLGQNFDTNMAQTPPKYWRDWENGALNEGGLDVSELVVTRLCRYAQTYGVRVRVQFVFQILYQGVRVQEDDF